MHELKHSTNSSRYEVMKSLEHFMSSKDRMTLALNGKWGCGKTHFWKAYVEKNRTVVQKRYAYVSLFDVGSIQELKSKIVMASFLRDSNAWKKHTKSIVGAAGEVLEKVPYVQQFLKMDATLSAIEDLYLKDFLICIDDIERRSASLDMAQFLGFVSVLREHRNCRVVLILNEGQLETEDQKILDKYRDKIIDMELQFRPSVRENAELVLKGIEFEVELVDVFERSGTNNIRVMQKTLWRVQRLLEIVPDEYPEARRDMTQQLAILCCLHYSEDNRVDINKIRGLQSWHSILSDRDPSDESAVLAERLGILGWDYPTHEGLVINIVLHEIFDEVAIREAATKVHARYRDTAFLEEFNRPFEMFQANFQGSLDEIHQELQGLLDNQLEKLDWSQLGRVLSLLMDIGDKPNIAKYQSEWIEAHPDAFSDEETLEEFLHIIHDGAVKARVNELARQTKPKLDLADCMVQVTYGKTWGGHVSKALVAATEDDFFDLLSTRKEGDLIPLVRKFLDLATSFGKQDQAWADLANRIRAALRKVGNQSDLNQARIKRFFASQLNIHESVPSAEIREDQDRDDDGDDQA